MATNPLRHPAGRPAPLASRHDRRHAADTTCGPEGGTNGAGVATVVAMEQDTPQEPASVAAESDVVEELLVEEISIDGMCGVY